MISEVLLALYKLAEGQKHSTSDMILADVAFTPNVYGNMGNTVPVICAELG